MYHVCRMKDDDSGAQSAHYALLAQEKAMTNHPAESAPLPHLIDYMPRCFNQADSLVSTSTASYTEHAFQKSSHVFLQDINFPESLSKDDLRELGITPPEEMQMDNFAL